MMLEFWVFCPLSAILPRKISTFEEAPHELRSTLPSIPLSYLAIDISLACLVDTQLISYSADSGHEQGGAA